MTAADVPSTQTSQSPIAYRAAQPMHRARASSLFRQIRAPTFDGASLRSHRGSSRDARRNRLPESRRDALPAGTALTGFGACVPVCDAVTGSADARRQLLFRAVLPGRLGNHPPVVARLPSGASCARCSSGPSGRGSLPRSARRLCASEHLVAGAAGRAVVVDRDAQLLVRRQRAPCQRRLRMRSPSGRVRSISYSTPSAMS